MPHTPGTWEAIGLSVVADHEGVASIEVATATLWFGPEQGHANARLIAAASDLLFAAKQAAETMEWAEANLPGTHLQSDLILLRHAIAKAEREERSAGAARLESEDTAPRDDERRPSGPEVGVRVPSPAPTEGDPKGGST